MIYQLKETNQKTVGLWGCEMILVKRRIVDERMTGVLLTFQDTSSYTSKIIHDSERRIWDVVEDGLGLNSFRWDFPKHNQWIGSVK